MCPYAIFTAYALDTFPQALYLWNDNMSHTGSSPRGDNCLAVVPASIAVLHCIANVGVTTILPVAIYYSVLYLIYGPTVLRDTLHRSYIYVNKPFMYRSYSSKRANLSKTVFSCAPDLSLLFYTSYNTQT